MSVFFIVKTEFYYFKERQKEDINNNHLPQHPPLSPPQIVINYFLPLLASSRVVTAPVRISRP